MAEVNWREVFAVSSLVLALMLIGGSIYLHVQQKHHLGRLHHESSVSSASGGGGGGGVDAAVVTVSQTLPPTSTTPSADDDDDDINARTTLRNTFYDPHNSDDDLSSGSGDTDSDDSEEYREYIRNQLKLEDRVTEIMSSLTEKSVPSVSKSESEEDLMTSTEQIFTTTTPAKDRSSTTVDDPLSSRHITEACLQCVWETVAQCRPASCNSNVPGRISHSYWLDAGKPKLEGDFSEAGEIDEGYIHCVNNAYCAGRAVGAFVNRYARDCNQDGIIDCRDHISLHILGPSGCMTSELTTVFESRMENCLENFENDKGGL